MIFLILISSSEKEIFTVELQWLELLWDHGKGHKHLIRYFLFFFFFFFFFSFFLKVNQVIYSSTLISISSFKALAKVVFELSNSQDFIMSHSLAMPESIKGHNSGPTSPSDQECNGKENNTGHAIFS